MSFDELMNIRKYLVSANVRLIELCEKCGLSNDDTWCRNSDAWDVIWMYMNAHPELR